MELWKQLRQAGLVPPELGLPPRALRGVPPVERVGLPISSPGADTGSARERLLWIWEELGNLRRVDAQLLSQLCSLGLEMGVLREELGALLEEEAEESSEQEEDRELERKQEGASSPVPGHHLPDFEMTI